MSEEELNEKYIRNKIEGICQDCMWLDKILPIINKMLSEQYIKGLEQGKFDEMMDKLQLINWLESKNQFHYKNGKIEDNYILVSEVLNKVRGD